MNFNVISQNQRFISFCKYLQDDGHKVTVVNGQFSDCDVMIYDTQFKQQLVNVTDCIRIELTDTQKDKDFAISFGQAPGAYQIQDYCFFMGEGSLKKELSCDIGSVNQDLNKVPFINRYMNHKYVVKIFNNEPLSLYNYCGVVRGKQVSDVYASAKISLCLNKPSVLMALESGGNVITDSDYGLGLDSSQVFYDENDFYEKVDAVLNGNVRDMVELRNRLLKDKSPFQQWANIFNQVGLEKTGQKMLKTGDNRLNALYFK